MTPLVVLDITLGFVPEGRRSIDQGEGCIIEILYSFIVKVWTMMNF